MPHLPLEGDEALRYEYVPATSPAGVCFVFFNPLTGSLDLWSGAIAAALRAQGHGTLLWNLRGQASSPVSPERTLDTELAIADARRLLDELGPPRPVLVGLSIGGLYAARVVERGYPARALALINTLRRDGPRLRWINDALFRAAQVGGLRLLRDLFAPRLFGEDWLAAHRSEFLDPAPYEPLDPKDGHYRLLRDSAGTDWNVAWERLDLPTLVMTGLEDGLFYDQTDVDRLLARLPRARRVDVTDAGHMLPAERPQRVIDELLVLAEEA